MIIREARACDAIRVALLILARQGTFDAPIEAKRQCLETVIAMIDSRFHYVIIAEDLEDGVVGMMLGEASLGEPDKLLAWGLYIVDHHRNKTIAKKMIDFGMGLAKGRGCKTIRFKTGPNGKGYYETMGAKVVELEYELCLE
jgi:GNAT superfamily N-acetyltransferase